MFIDPHVHCRDEEQAYKESIMHALAVAKDSGVDAIFDMPNTHRPIFNEKRVKDRLKIAQEVGAPEVFYGLFLGLTADSEQLKKAVDIHKKYFPKVVGFKMYAGHSTGNLGITKLEEQAKVYENLSQNNYPGIMFVHCEKESRMNKNIGITFDPKNPITHCLARPPEAEIESVKDQIMLARQFKFPGKLHIAHISHPKSVEFVLEAKSSGLDISCGVCPHHIFYNSRQMNEENGILWKMNPPLREPGIPVLMLEYLREGKIDWIETDHAPHTKEEKKSSGYLSGIPGLAWWTLFAEYLRHSNFSDQLIEKLTFTNARDRFGIDIKAARRKIRDRRHDYPFNPYMQMEQLIK